MCAATALTPWPVCICIPETAIMKQNEASARDAISKTSTLCAGSHSAENGNWGADNPRNVRVLRNGQTNQAIQTRRIIPSGFSCGFSDCEMSKNQPSGRTADGTRPGLPAAWNLWKNLNRTNRNKKMYHFVNLAWDHMVQSSDSDDLKDDGLKKNFKKTIKCVVCEMLCAL